MLINSIILVFFNFVWNYFAGNDCGFYSIRGFTAFLISVCTISASILILLILLAINLINGSETEQEKYDEE